VRRVDGGYKVVRVEFEEGMVEAIALLSEA
jgi:hypothetical protein